ncbi:class II glutamine amidotransferase [Thermococcus sp. LS1]|uniref:class II glutamine amidotransferase n=1 Tax=Thermococcus sp. LS1 TaxID=1638259 RepID=UPI0014397606|nr:class II glutamine amidotransferase [Thermococcus sp. LS1]NJD99604.1 class II glutamine amidotransferase [Thermococcus sp. LS1]
MCRILFAAGDGKEIIPLVDAIVKASENDPYKERRGRGRQHRDGWGYVLLKDGSVRHYRSIKPIFEDFKAVKSLKTELGGFSVLMIHTRAASQGVKNLFNVQPFAFSTRRGFNFWLLHNGDLDKAKIVELAELDEKDLRNASDSYTFATYLCRRLPSPKLEDLLVHYRIIEETTKSVFNTMTLFQSSEGDFSAFITAKMVDKLLQKPEYYDYSKLLLLREENLFAVASSTLELYHKAHYEIIPNETAFYVKILEENVEVETVHL